MSTITASQPSLFSLRRRENGAGSQAAQGEREMLEIAALSPEEAMARLGTKDAGLDSYQVEERRERYGPNVVESGRKHGILSHIAGRFANPLAVQLLLICGVCLAIGDVPSASIVGVMVVLSVALAIFQETKSNRAVERLLAMVKTTCI